MKHRKDDLIGIRKARFASFVLLLTCFAALIIIFEITESNVQLAIVSVPVIVCLSLCWWFVYRRILIDEANFFETLSADMRAVYHRLRMLESAVRKIGDGVVIVADSGEFVIVNETARRLLASFDSEMDGSVYDEYAAGFSEKLERDAILAAARESRSSEIVVVDGHFYKIGYIALVSEGSREEGAVCVISDVTESTKAENMQIDFVANVSHELKTPLASVKGYAETLMANAVDDEETVQEFLGIIVSEANRMDRLVKDLLYLTRIDYQDKDKESLTNVSESDLPSLIKASMKKLDMSAGEKKLSLNRMFSGDLRLSIEMDRDRIEQVIFNILGNAIKYTEEKGRVDVDIISGQNCVQIVISDSGVGIPEEDIPRAFERFWRGNRARTGKIGGTGLGLAISKQIVDAHGGTLGIESRVGRGTTVTISLPTGKSRGTPGIL